MRSLYLDDSAKAVASALKIDPYFVRWERVDPLHDDALVIHTPWARVVVARSVGGADRFVSDYLVGDSLWLFDALEEAYPVEASPTLRPERLLEIPLADGELRGFRKWAISASRQTAWPVTPFTEVVGSWTTYRKGLLLRHADGRCVLRTRGAPSLSLGGLHVNTPRSPHIGIPAALDQLDGRSGGRSGPLRSFA